LNSYSNTAGLNEVAQWESDFLLAKEYRADNSGNNPPRNSTENARLRRWIDKHVALAARPYLTDLQRERIRRLREEGIIRPYSQDESEESWFTHYSEFLQYTARHGHLPPLSHDLGKWYDRQRTLAAGREGNKPRYQRIRNDGYLGRYDDINWDLMYKLVRQYCEMSGNNWPTTSKFDNWEKKQRDSYFTGKLSEEQRDKLNDIEIDWKWGRNKRKILKQLVVSRNFERSRTDTNTGRPNRYAHARIDFVQRAKLAGISKEVVRRKLNYLQRHDNLDRIWETL